MEEKHSISSAAAAASDSTGLTLYASRQSHVRFKAARLWQARWFLLCVSISFALLGLIVGAARAPLYRVQASVEVHAPPAVHPTPEHESEGRRADAPPSGSYIQTQLRIAESRSLLERALGKFSQPERARLLESPWRWWSRYNYGQNLDSLRSRLSVSVGGDANILDIRFLTPDPVAGAHLLNALTQELSDYTVETSWRVAQHRRQWTDRQLDDLRRRWEESERILAEYSQSLQASAPVAVAPVQAASKVVEHDQNDAKLAQLRVRLAGIEREITQWTSLYGLSSPTVARLKAEAASTSAALRVHRAVRARAIAAPPSTDAASRAGRPETIAHLNVLRQEAESNRVNYQNAASRLQESRLSAASQVGDISIVDTAVSDGRPVSPNQLLNGTIGAFTGLLLGAAFVALRHRYARTFAGPSALEEYLGLQVLGAVPLAQSTAVALSENPEEPVLHLAFGHDAETAEAYRSLRSTLFVKAADGSGARRLVFTSAVAEEGKTAVIGNLGAALASAQRRVLLVDGDLRNPGLHKVFGASNAHGLADLLSRQLSANPVATRDVIRATQVPGLYLLSAGEAGPLAPEILSALQLPQLIIELSNGFDFVLIDSPPVLPYSDARILARAADAAILIVRTAVTSRESALLARDAIARDGINILGSVLTGWDRARAAYA